MIRPQALSYSQSPRLRGVVQPYLGYSREALQRELRDVFDAHLICYYRLIALNDAEFETFLRLFDVSNRIMTRYLEIVQVLKGVCEVCGYTPCVCDYVGVN